MRRSSSQTDRKRLVSTGHRSLRRWSPLFLLAVLALGSSPEVADAIPRYAARYQQSCTLCHLNPSGGGKRTAYANQFLIPMEMSALAWAESEQIDRLDPQISESVSVGADLRTLHLYSEDKAHRNGFFEMQADFYALIEVDPRFSLYLDQGQSQTREVFGLGYVLPSGGYVKVGRFTPAFGWKFADHNLFTRSMLGFAPPNHTDAGVEVGFSPKDMTFQLALHNGASSSIIDDDHRTAGTGRAVLRRRIKGVSIALGGSYFYNEHARGLVRAAGPFGSLHWGPLTWVGELDWRSEDGATGPGSDELISSHEFAFGLQRGVDLRFTYDFFDPDVDTQTGSLSRYGFGIDTLLYPFLGIQASVHHATFESGSTIEAAQEFTQTVLLAHFFF